MYSLGSRLKVPQGFSKGKPEATYKARPKAKNPRGCRPQGFLAFGRAEDIAKGSPLKISKGAFNILPREYIEYSRDLLRAQFTMIPSRLSHRLSLFLPNTLVY